jgi:Uma2 family endonuclease
MSIKAVTRAAEGLDRRAFSVADVERMIEAGILDQDDKFELIGGEIVPVSPQARPHLVVKMRLARWLIQANLEGLEVSVEPTLQCANQALLEPDVAVTLPIVMARGFIPISDVRLAIDVADTTLARDLSKARDYAAAGLEELWIVDLGARRTVLFATENGVWRERAPALFSENLSPMCAPHLSVRLSELVEASPLSG